MQTQHVTVWAKQTALFAAVAFAALAGPAAAQSRPQLSIVQAEADLAAETLLIQGEYFTWANDTEAVVTLGGNPLTVLGIDAGHILAQLPPALAPGGYLLKVSRGNGSVQNDTFALTVGAVGPQGPDGPQGPQGPPGSGPANQACPSGYFVSGFDAAGSLICRTPGATCGNGVLETGEQCDDSNTSGGDGCSYTCTTEVCGNGVVDPLEQCDDANSIAGDGCSGACAFEKFVDVIVVVDSGSTMADYRSTLAALLGDTRASLLAAGIDARVALVGSDLCVPPPLGSGSCPNDENLPHFRHVANFVSGVDGLQALLDEYGNYRQVLRPNVPKHFVAFVDDDSGLSASSFTSQAAALTDPGFPNGYKFHSVVVMNRVPNPFPGLPDVPECGNAVGTEYLALSGAAGGLTANVCTGDPALFFDALLTAIVQEASPSN